MVLADTFTIQIFQGGTAYFEYTVTENRDPQIDFDGFTINNPDSMRITVTNGLFRPQDACSGAFTWCL